MNLKASEFISHTVLESDMDTDGYLDFGSKVLFCKITLSLNQLFALSISIDKYIFASFFLRILQLYW